MKTHAIRLEPVHLGFQIAPMIDVVFVIMLFFMVMAGAMRAERELTSMLPRGDAMLTDIPPYEILIGISEDGLITINDEEIAAENDTVLKSLNERLEGIQKESAASGTQPIVILQTEEQTRYQRIVDVLNVLGRLKLTNVTFTLGTEE